MAPSLFSIKELRRRSKASFRAESRSTDTSSTESNGTTPTSGSLTPPSIANPSDPALNDLMLKETPPSNAPAAPSLRPSLHSTPPSKRNSASGMMGLGSSPYLGGRTSSLPISQYAPRFANLNENTWVYQKVLLVHGTIGEPNQNVIDGTLTVSRLDDNLPSSQWPVCDSNYKALVYLLPGPNRLRFDFSSPKLANSTTSNPLHASYITIHMLPPTNAPPLQLAIVLGSDSPETFDAVPARAEKEGNGLETAVRKFRMAAYLWQAFTAEQMLRNKLGRRAFRFEEEWTTGSANHRDRDSCVMRSEARIHIVRSDKTVAELRAMARDAAGASSEPGRGDELFRAAADAVRASLRPQPGQKLYVSAMLLDTHWDAGSRSLAGHTAEAGSSGDLELAVFGSHCLQSYPTSIEEVVPAFTDCTPTDVSYVANEAGEAGSSWEAANVGIGAHLHQTGKLFGCRRQDSGIMMKDYLVINRTFVAREAYSTRTRSRGGMVLQDDECTWHRLDCLRFRSHPCFRIPQDPTFRSDESIQAWPVENGSILLNALTGISFVEIYGDNDRTCSAWIEYPADSNGSFQKQVVLSEQDLRDRQPEGKRKGTIRILARSHAGGNVEITDFKKLASKDSSVKLATGKTGFRGKMTGSPAASGKLHDVVFTSAIKQDRVLSEVTVYLGEAVRGIEFRYDDNSTQLLGTTGEGEGHSFELDVRRGEYITGIFVRSGPRIEAFQLLTSLGRRSALLGSAFSGAPQTFMPPRGYTICGVAGSSTDALDSFSVLITR